MHGSNAGLWSTIPRHYNLGVDLTRRHVDFGHGDRTCLIWENSAGANRTLTYGDMDVLSNRCAAMLARLGVKRGDRVLLRLPNLPEFYIAALGVAKLGGVFIPTSTQFRANEIEYRLRDSGAVVAITTDKLVDELDIARSASPDLRDVLIVSTDGVTIGGPHRDFWREVNQSPAEFTAADTLADDIAFIAYTSGTTGEPKGVVHAHRYAAAYDYLIRDWHDYRAGDVCACPAELGWLLPVASTFLYAMRAGIASMLYHPVDGRFRAEAWFQLIAKYGITNFVGTPTIYRMLIASPEIGAAQLSSLRHGVSAGEPLPPDTIQAAKRHLGFEPLDGIGMSECMVYCYNRVSEQLQHGSCGRPAPQVPMRLVDDALRDVAPGEPGVLCVRRADHPGMMHGYWNKPEQTAEIFRGEWYYSGDVLVQDAAGNYWFQGRADDVIKASGYRISPFELESCLAAHPCVHEAAVVGAPDELRGTVVKAFIVLRPGAEASVALIRELQDWVKQNSAGYKYPRQVEFVLELPKTTSGKIKRRLLRSESRHAA
ncbi:MAG: acyl-CoA synthetase [Planctomycetia bacterium]|nr:acyl-CoA synthetase [Planctomycetia bacterium]